MYGGVEEGLGGSRLQAGRLVRKLTWSSRGDA